MRLLAVCSLAVLCVGCGRPADPPTASSAATPTAVAINPARIDRARSELPDGYEVASYEGPPTPITLWGFTDDAASDPVQCRALAAPAVDPGSARGWSASGPGGIVYALVGMATPPTVPDPALRAECARWSLTSAHTSGTVAERHAPDIDGAQTLAMSVAAVTVVEGGTETRSHAETFVAYLGDYICTVTLVTDPGAPYPTLDPGFGATLLSATVSALRG